MNCELYFGAGTCMVDPEDDPEESDTSFYQGFFVEQDQKQTYRYSTFCRELLLNRYKDIVRYASMFSNDLPMNMFLSVVPVQFNYREYTDDVRGAVDTMVRYFKIAPPYDAAHNGNYDIGPDLRLDLHISRKCFHSFPVPPALSLYVLIAGTTIRTYKGGDPCSWIVSKLLDKDFIRREADGVFREKSYEALFTAFYAYLASKSHFRWHDTSFWYGYGPSSCVLHNMPIYYSQFLDFVDDYEDIVLPFLSSEVSGYPPFIKAILKPLISVK